MMNLVVHSNRYSTDEWRNGATIEIRRSLRSILSLITLFFLSVGMIYGIEHYSSQPGALFSFYRLGFSPRWLMIFPCGILLEIVRRYNDDLYIFSSDRLQHLDGRLSLTYHVPSIRYEDIRAMRVNQGIVGRILDYGDLEISTAAQDRSELIIGGVRSPKRLLKLIDDLRTQRLIRSEIESEEHKAPAPTQKFQSNPHKSTFVDTDKHA